MGKCIVCGKHGLFFKVNSSGRCPDCEAKEQARLAEIRQKEAEERQIQIAAEKKAASELFDEITKKLKEFKDKEDIIETLGSNAVEKAENIETVAELINDYQTIIDRINSQRFDNNFKMVISSKIQSDPNASNGRGYLPDWKTVVFTNQPRAAQIDEVLSHICSKFQKAINEYETIPKDLERYVRFEKRIASIPPHEFTEDLQTEEVKPITLSSKVKLSQVTAKDFYTELGFFVAVAIDNDSVGAVRYENWKAQDKVKLPLTPEGMTQLSAYIGENNIVGADVIDTMMAINKIGASFLSENRKYYDSVLLCEKYMRTEKWQKEHHYNNPALINLDTLCTYYEIRDNNALDQTISDCCASASLFSEVCMYRAV